MSERIQRHRPDQEQPRDLDDPTTTELDSSEASPREREEMRPQAHPPEQADEGRAGRREGLLPPDEADELRRRWESVQASFVDQPRNAVTDADEIVGQVIHRIEERFETERSRLEAAWASGEDVSTEELRIALRRYAAFFNRLLEL